MGASTHPFRRSRLAFLAACLASLPMQALPSQAAPAMRGSAPAMRGSAPAMPGSAPVPEGRRLWRQHQWSLFPGVYRSYDGETSGFEVTLLPNGFFGACIGIEKQGLRYIEAEWALWVISLGVGVRRRDAGGTAFQATVAFPVLPIFPYMRFNTSGDGKNDEYGFMIKLPLFFGEPAGEPRERPRSQDNFI